LLNLDTYAYASPLRKRNPLEKLEFSLLTLGVCLWADWTIVSITVLAVMGWVTVRKGGTPFFVFIRLLSIPGSFLVSALLTLVVELTKDPRDLAFAVPFFHSYLGLTNTGCADAVRLFWKSMGAASCLYFIALTTPFIQIPAALRRVKCPELLIELTDLMYRFIFILIETARQMVVAQSSRLGYVSLASGYRSLGALGSTLFIRAYRRANELFVALESRGYEDKLKTLPETYSGDGSGYRMSILFNGLLVAATLLFKRH
jgi:cobalt/nickel transport system permease protein